jgi:hypothetical protein
MALDKREHVRPTISVRPDGPLAGHEFVMTRIPAPTYIALRRGEIDDGDLMGLALEAIEDTTLPDGTVLDMAEGMALMTAWTRAHREEALPPVNGTDSGEP